MSLHHKRAHQGRARGDPRKATSLVNLSSSGVAPEESTSSLVPSTTSDAPPLAVAPSTTTAPSSEINPGFSHSQTTTTSQQTSTSTSAQPVTSSTTSIQTTSSSSTRPPPSTSLSSTSTTNPTTQPVVTLTAAAITQTQTNADPLDSTSTLYPAMTVSPSSTSAPSGSNAGAIVGGVVGTIAAVAIVGLIIAFLLRRWRRNRTTDEDFNPDDFAVPPNFSNPAFARSSTFDPSPPNMAQLNGYNARSSVSSGPGMAGQGVFGSRGLQERQVYTYGQSSEITADEADGPYSSEPHAQVPYNAEAYGSYAYSTDSNQPVYHPYQAPEFQTHYQDSPHAPALVPGASSIPAERGTNPSNRSIYDERDAYGGI